MTDKTDTDTSPLVAAMDLLRAMIADDANTEIADTHLIVISLPGHNFPRLFTTIELESTLNILKQIARFADTSQTMQ